MPCLTDRLELAERRLRMATDALIVYADEKNWRLFGTRFRPAEDKHGGQVARNALLNIEQAIIP